MNKNKKGVVSIYLTFMIVSIIIVLIAAAFAPMGVLFNTKMFEAGEDILLRANDSIENIQDPNVKASVTENIGQAIEAADNNIEVNSDIFQYGWILVIGMAALVIFLFTRRLVETSGGGLA